MTKATNFQIFLFLNKRSQFFQTLDNWDWTQEFKIILKPKLGVCTTSKKDGKKTKRFILVWYKPGAPATIKNFENDENRTLFLWCYKMLFLCGLQRKIIKQMLWTMLWWTLNTFSLVWTRLEKIRKTSYKYIYNKCVRWHDGIWQLYGQYLLDYIVWNLIGETVL